VQSALLARISKVASHQRELVLPLPSATKAPTPWRGLAVCGPLRQWRGHACRALFWRPPTQRRLYPTRRPCGVQPVV